MNLTIQQSAELKELGFPQLLQNGDYFFKAGVGYIYTQEQPYNVVDEPDFIKRPSVADMIDCMIELSGGRVGIIASASLATAIAELKTDDEEIDANGPSVIEALYNLYHKLIKSLSTKPKDTSMDEQNQPTPAEEQGSTTTAPATAPEATQPEEKTEEVSGESAE